MAEGPRRDRREAGMSGTPVRVNEFRGQFGGCWIFRGEVDGVPCQFVTIGDNDDDPGTIDAESLISALHGGNRPLVDLQDRWIVQGPVGQSGSGHLV